MNQYHPPEMAGFSNAVQSNPWSMGHPLDGAIARLDRADRHAQELESCIERHRQTCEGELIRQNQEMAAQITKGMPNTSVPVQPLNTLPIDIPVIVGEFVYSLRAALDYLVFELALHDSGSEQQGTQFPIEDFKIKTGKSGRKLGFDGRIGTYLKGLSPVHVDAVEKLQPYKGVTWTKTLRDISNPDKHRKLSAVWSLGDPVMSLWFGGPKRSDGSVDFGVESGHEFHFELKYSLQVLLPDGTTVVQTLKMLKGQVAETIQLFKLEF